MDIQSSPPANNTPTPSQMGIKYFILVFIISVFFMGRILWPFWSILVLSFLLSNLFRPIYVYLTKYMREGFASILTCILIIAIVFIPLIYFTFAITDEAFNLYNWGRDSQVGLKLQRFLQESTVIAQLREYLREVGFDFKPDQLSEFVSSMTNTGVRFIYNQIIQRAANVMQFLALFSMMILVIFFLLTDQPKLVDFLIRLSPLPDDEDRLLLKKFEEIANAILKGNGICGIIQGVLGGAVFSIIGINSPILWGSIMAVLAFLPIFGIGLVMIPAAILFGINGKIGTGVFLFIFYLILSLSMEYLVKPKLVGSQVKMHTLLVFLSIIGGLSVYGVLGIIYGPLIVTAFLTLTDIYFKKYDYHIQRM